MQSTEREETLNAEIQALKAESELLRDQLTILEHKEAKIEEKIYMKARQLITLRLFKEE